MIDHWGLGVFSLCLLAIGLNILAWAKRKPKTPEPLTKRDMERYQ